MAQTWNASDAKKLIENHQGLVEQLKQTVSKGRKYEQDVEKAVKAYRQSEEVSILESIPVEAVNQDEEGIRVKTLRDNGYENLWDLQDATMPKLTRIGGITKESARTIMTHVREMTEEAKNSVKLSLSLDHQTEKATDLVKTVSKYRKLQSMIVDARILMEQEFRVGGLIQNLEPATKTLSYVFTSSQVKAKAEAAYEELNELWTGEYGQMGRAISEGSFRTKNQSAEDAWKEFEENTVEFYTVLEKLAPGQFGTDDQVYGLPEELATQVSAENPKLDGLNCTLRGYQDWGVKYILRQGRVLLGDEMGLGKTVQAIASMVALANEGATHFVVVCPASVLSNWIREVSKFSSLRVTEIHGSDKGEELTDWLEQGGVAVTTYETTGFMELEDKYRFAMLIVDEAHYIKNPNAKRSQNVRKLADHADRMLFMTGTALENKVDEMVNLLDILDNDMASQVKRMTYLSTAPKFREKIASVYYRRRREDVLKELPELTESEEWAKLDSEEKKVYQKAVLKKKYTEARRVSWSVDDLSQSTKARRLLEIIAEAESEGRKVIVFSFFLDTISKIKGLLGDKATQPINGSVTPARRQEILDEFEKAPAGAVLLAQIQAGGTGLNIQAASVVILCEPQFKPSIENQAIARAYRMGQARNVLVYRLLSEKTVDEKVMGILEEKQKVFDAFADPSAAADGVEYEVDEKTFQKAMDQEAEEIRVENGLTEEDVKKLQEEE